VARAAVIAISLASCVAMAKTLHFNTDARFHNVNQCYDTPTLFEPSATVLIIVWPMYGPMSEETSDRGYPLPKQTILISSTFTFMVLIKTNGLFSITKSAD
jgi:hypothetical protein